MRRFARAREVLQCIHEGHRSCLGILQLTTCGRRQKPSSMPREVLQCVLGEGRPRRLFELLLTTCGTSPLLWPRGWWWDATEPRMEPSQAAAIVSFVCPTTKCWDMCTRWPCSGQDHHDQRKELHRDAAALSPVLCCSLFLDVDCVLADI